MLHSCTTHHLHSSSPQVVSPRLVLEGPLFQHYFDKVEVSNFEVASDAFSTFKVYMHPSLHGIGTI